jgi:hypothetical protein
MKIKYRHIFRACQVTLKEWPSGGSDVFRMLDRQPENAWTQFNPDALESGPSLLMLLEVLEYTKSRRIAHALGEVSGHITLPSPDHSTYAVSRTQAADNLGAAMRPALYNLDTFASRPSAADRQKMQADLLHIIDAAHVMLMRLQG